MRDAEALDRGAHHLADLKCRGGVGVRHQQAKLFGAIASGETHGIGGHHGKRFAEPGKAGVALGVAVGVVVELEVSTPVAL